MKIHLTLFSTLFSLFFMTTVAQAADLPFTDVGQNVHFEAIYRMKEWGIFDGYADGSFGYLKEINRAELSKALVLGSGLSEEEVSSCAEGASKSFNDVSQQEWYSNYVYCAQAKGWVSGDDGKSTFRPGDPVLLPEAFKMILESQYGTPASSFEGDQWYDVYINALINSNILFESSSGGYYGYTFLPGYSSIGFTSDIASKTTRQDIAELLYRVRTVLEAGDGELTHYDPVISISEYQETYGASIEETSPGVLTIRDPHFDFQITNVYIGELDASDLKIFIEDPAGFENGSTTDWNLMYPSLQTSFEKENLDVDPMFTIRIRGNGGEPTPDSWCTSTFSRSFELWEIYDTLCGEEGVNADDLSSLLQLTAYGEDYMGEMRELEPIKNGPLSILKFNQVMTDAATYAYFYGNSDGDYLTYLASLAGLQSEDSEQEAELQEWREKFIASYDSMFELSELIQKYEQKVLADMSDTLVLKIHLNQATSYNQVDYIIYDVSSSDYEILEGEGGNYFWPSFSLYFSEANDPFQGKYFGKDQGLSGVWLEITVKNEPILSEDFDKNSVNWNHVFVYAKGLYQNAYYYEIAEAEVLE